MILWLCGNLMLLGAGLLFWAWNMFLREEWRDARRQTFKLEDEVDRKLAQVKLGLAEIERVRQEAIRLSKQHGRYSREESYEFGNTLNLRLWPKEIEDV